MSRGGNTRRVVHLQNQNYLEQERQERLNVKLSCLSEHVRM